MRFCIQDIYRSGRKDIVVGKVVSGIIQNGQNVMALPKLIKTKVKGIKIYGTQKKKAYAGENIGICLENMKGLKRGYIIAERNSFPFPLQSFESKIFWLSRQPLWIHQPLSLRLATQETPCVAETIEDSMDSATLRFKKGKVKELKLHQMAKVILKTKKALIAENFSFIDEIGRFVVERENRLVGVGIVSKAG